MAKIDDNCRDRFILYCSVPQAARLFKWTTFSATFEHLFSEFIYGMSLRGEACVYELLMMAYTTSLWAGFEPATTSMLVPSSTTKLTGVWVYVEHVAERLSCWTRDLEVWGMILAALLCKSLGKALNPQRLCPTSSNGYQVKWKIDTVWIASAADNVLHSPQGDATVK